MRAITLRDEKVLKRIMKRMKKTGCPSITFSTGEGHLEIVFSYNLLALQPPGEGKVYNN